MSLPSEFPYRNKLRLGRIVTVDMALIAGGSVPSRQFLLGVLSALSLPGFFAAWIAPGLAGDDALSEASRMIEGTTLLLLVGNLGIAILLLALRAWKVALFLGVATLCAGLSTGLRASAFTAPLSVGRPAMLNLVWWNVYGGNPLPAPRLVEEIAGFDADIVILGEPRALKPALDILRERYPYNMGCEVDDRCDLVILSRMPLRTGAPLFNGPRLISNGLIRNHRLAVFRINTKQGPLNIVATHQSKPWYGAVHRVEARWLRDVLASMTGPTVMVGDFNAPPWGQVMTDLAEDSGMRMVPKFRPTWPIGLGPLGIPIDHVLVRDGARLTYLNGLAADLGSNHRGLQAGITLQPLIDIGD